MTLEIVPPEPYRKPNFKGAWGHIPRWARVVLWVIAIAAAILTAFLTR